MKVLKQQSMSPEARSDKGAFMPFSNLQKQLVNRIQQQINSKLMSSKTPKVKQPLPEDYNRSQKRKVGISQSR